MTALCDRVTPAHKPILYNRGREGAREMTRLTGGRQFNHGDGR